MLMPRILLWFVISCICLTGADNDDEDDDLAAFANAEADVVANKDDAFAKFANESNDSFADDDGFAEFANATPDVVADEDDALAQLANDEVTAPSEDVSSYDYDNTKRIIDPRIQAIELMLEKNYTDKMLNIDIQKQLVQDIAYLLYSIEITTASQVPTTCATLTPPPTTSTTTPPTTTTSTTTTTTAPTTTTTSKPRACGANKICVPFWNCKNGPNKYGNFNLRIDNLCGHYMQTCCQVSEIVSTMKSPSSLAILTRFPQQKPKKNVPCDLSNEDKGCGVANDKGVCVSVSNKLKGETEFGEFPWAVTIKVQEQVFGGTLISESTVLTACSQIKTKENETTLVIAGQWDRATNDGIIPYQQRRVKKVICDPEFDLVNAENDLALLRLDRPFDLKAHIRPVCLPPKDDIDYNTCIVTGWNSWMQLGRSTLRRANASFECAKKKKKKTKICAKIDEAILSYSNGSPLVCRRVNDNSMRYYLAGIWTIGTKEIMFAKIADSYERIKSKGN